jgi:hypothetical protein
LGTLLSGRLAVHPAIMFWSENAWVDEPEGRVYVAYKGHLLSLPLVFESDKTE